MSLIEVPVLVEHLKKLKKEIEELEEAIKSLRETLRPEKVAKPIITEKVLNNRRATFRLDLSTARTDEPLGVLERTVGIPANFMIVQRLDNPAQMKLNSTSADLEDLSTGYSVEDFEINEIYITNPATSGELVITIEWRV